MSEIDRVMDYMSGLPQSYEHAKMYAEEFANRSVSDGVRIVDGVTEEKKILSRGEMEILGRLHCPDKFTRKDFFMSVNVGVSVSCGDADRVRRDRKYELSFEGTEHWGLEAAASSARYSATESTAHLMNDAQKKAIVAMCPNISGEVASDIFIASVHERISVPQDMRHLFTKMYLLLCDFNLAVTSKGEDMTVDTQSVKLRMRENCSDIDRLGSICRHDIVIDTGLFTPGELGLLNIAAQEYPSVWYGPENIYTKCHVGEDDLIFVSDGKITIDNSMMWGSPDRLYQIIWSVAAKLNAVDALISVFENMRGKCSLMASITPKTRYCSVNSMMPKSYSMATAFGRTITSTSMTNAPGYFSSSISLIADLLYGMTFEAVATCVCEDIGGIGRQVSSKTPATSLVFNGLLRDFGLQHTTARDNVLLQNWAEMAGKPMTWDFGGMLKEYVVALCTMISNGADIQIPQLLHSIPALNAVHTAYGISRGWKGKQATVAMTKQERADRSDCTASVAWLMGVRDVRPQVFANRNGRRPIHIGMDENRLAIEVGDSLQRFKMGIWLHDSLGGRIDEHEVSGSALFRTEYAGIKCSMVYSEADMAWQLQPEPNVNERQSLSGVKERKAEEVPQSNSKQEGVAERTEAGGPEKKLGLEGVHWGSTVRNSPKGIFKDIAALGSSSAIKPSARAAHARVNSSGVSTVPQYTMDGEANSDMLPSRRTDAEEGEEIKFSTISAAGDGRCGINAMVEDLKVHGRLSPSDVLRATQVFSDTAIAKEFHAVEDLAAVAQQWGMSIDVLDKESGVLMRYGDGKGHTLSLVRSGSHFDAAVFGQGPNTVKISKVSSQENTPEEFVAHVKQYRSLFA